MGPSRLLITVGALIIVHKLYGDEVITGPDIAIQASTKHDLPKPRNQEKTFRPIVGGPSFITMNDAEWKHWRSTFSSGFSASHMLSLVPSIVDSMDVFCEILEKYAGRDVFSLDVIDYGRHAQEFTVRKALIRVSAVQDKCVGYMLSICGYLLLLPIIVENSVECLHHQYLMRSSHHEKVINRISDTDLDDQRVEHKFSRAVQTILHWHSFRGPLVLLNPLRIPIQWYYGRVLLTSIHGKIQKRFKEIMAEKLALAHTDRLNPGHVTALTRCLS
jgi:hypothetical protein